MPRYSLAIEISNPASGPRGETGGVLAGPGVALGRLDERGAEFLETELLGEGTRHDDDLMPAIDRLMRRHGAAPRELARIAVSVGPGGYTGLRIAVATAKMLAEATGAETIPVPSAPAAAWALPWSLAPAIVCLASKGSTVHATLLPVHRGQSWIAGAATLGIITADQVEPHRPRTLIADRFLPDAFREAAARIGAAIVEPVFSAEAVLQIAQTAAPVDPLALSPLYPREAEAVTLWRARRA